MNTIEKFDCTPRFVRLQVTHQMPAGSVTSEFRYLRFGFLDAILTKVCDAGLESRSQRFDRMSLTDCDESDLVARAVASSRGCINLVRTSANRSRNAGTGVVHQPCNGNQNRNKTRHK